MPSALLELTDISKSFGGVQALRAVDFTLNAGEIHGLVGEQFSGEHDLGVVRTQRRPTTRATPRTSSGETGFGPLLDESTFELRER